MWNLFAMYRVAKVLTVAEGAEPLVLAERLSHTADKSPLVLKSALEPTLPEAAAGGDYIWRMQFAGERDYQAWLADAGREAASILNDPALLRHVDAVDYEDGRAGSKRPLDRGVYRLLLINVNNAPDLASVARFECETYEMGLYIPGIVRWRISPVKEASGARPWTHIWEQEYQDLDGLLKSYMLHPHHWAWMNRWYDPECVEHMIDNHLCHSFCNFQSSFLEPENGP